MKSEWSMKSISDIAEINPRESLKKGSKAKKIPMDALVPFTRDPIFYQLEEFKGGSKFRNKDTLMARITPCLENGKTAQVLCLNKYEIGFGSTEYIVFRAKEKVDPNYLYYLICSPFVRDPAIKSMVGSSGRQRVQTDVVANLKVPVPEFEDQKRIGFILKNLDDKIQLNTQINKNLEEQMEALYKSWFIDFEPFGRIKPSDWQTQKIYSIANIIYGAPFSSKLFNTAGIGKPIIRIRDLKSQEFVTYTTEKHSKGHLIKPGDIVVGMDGEFRPYIWGNEEAWLNQRVCIFENKRPKGKAFLLFSIQPLLKMVEQTQIGTTVIHIGKKDFDTFEIVLPDAKTLNLFDEITTPMIEQIVNNSLEDKRLKVLRDTLLPKLMSGEIDVTTLDI